MISVILVYFILTNIIAAKTPVHLVFNGNATMYNYVAEIKTGLEKPVPHVSSFKIYAHLYIQEDTSNLSVNKAYLIWLSNVKYEVYNGPDVVEKDTKEHFLPDESLIIQYAFMAFYDGNNLPTLHGNCQISYDVHTNNFEPFFKSNAIVVTKIYEPIKCDKFVQNTYSHTESFGCYIEREEDLITSVRKELYFDKNGSSLFFNKLVAQEIFYYFPWMHKSEIYYLQIEQTLQFEKYFQEKVIFDDVDFQWNSITSDVSYKIPSDNEIVNKMNNITQNTERMDQTKLVLKIKNLIFQITDYIEENHLDINQLDINEIHIINNLLKSVSNLNVTCMEHVYKSFDDSNTTKGATASLSIIKYYIFYFHFINGTRKIFLEIISHIGTMDSCLFIRNIITRKKFKVPDNVAIMMLVKLPSYVKNSTEELLIQMEELLQMKNVTDKYVINSVLIKQAAILSFSSLIYKTYILKNEYDSPLLEMYLQYINSCILDHTNFEMKLVHIMALRNIQIGDIKRFLIPIISDELVIHERQEHMRLAASFAIAQAINNDKELVHKLFWPILSNSANSLQLRIVAYDMIMSQLLDLKCAMNVHWFMTNEQNKHLYNYHYTTIRSLAHLNDPCLRPVMELARKIWRLTKKRNNGDNLSGSYVIGYIDSKYGYGESIKVALNFDDITELPNMGIFEYTYSFGRKSNPVWGKKIIISDELIKNMMLKINEQQYSMLREGYLEACFIYHGRIVQVISIDKLNLNIESLYSTVNIFLRNLDIEKQKFKINWQDLSYRHFYEMSVSTDIGIPVTFYNRMPFVFSTHIEITEYSLSNEMLHVKLKSDTRALMRGSYDMVAYNPISNISHSIQKAAIIDIIYPQEANISYDFQGQNLKLHLFTLDSSKNKGIRIYTNNFVTIFDDENNVLKNHCPSCIHYKPVNQSFNYATTYRYVFDFKTIGLKYSQTLFKCGNDNDLLIAQQSLTTFRSEDSEVGYDPIFKLFISLSHKVFNEIVTPNTGYCGNLILINDDSDISNVEINFNWRSESIRKKTNSIFLYDAKNLYLYSSINTLSALNKSSIYFSSLNLTSYPEIGIEFHFIRKKPGENNLVGCMQLDKSNLLANSLTNRNFTFHLSHSKIDRCNTGDTFINGTFSSKVIQEYKTLRQEIRRNCSKEYKQRSIKKYLNNTTIATKNCLFQAIQNKSFIKYDIKISYNECNISANMIITDSSENSTKLLDWTIITGDYVHFTYIILAKIVENNNIAIKLYHGSYLLEIIPMDTALKVLFDGISITDYFKEIVLPSMKESFYDNLISLYMKGSRLELQLHHIPLTIYYTKSSLRIIMKDTLQSSSDGLCNQFTL
ncbi:PREDICTED: uncharacterized protein LOC105364329 [Ceratosolen solmsi marchali]|uniref:Uncharacterized protein LOC105364329 n=1 Tax=Ceratosolen solmsi marchali TaxID=326594 RepID=A0AAJ6YM17_9HYME|nr:PREDICTED: uncharacterized protein LOC105364329 [Ceratosolen solmsi marchali]